MNILDKILETKRAETALLNLATLYQEVERGDREVFSFREAILKSDSGIIAEFKRRSPSKGVINADADVAKTVDGYSLAGAAAISVLTDRDYFGGSFDDLRAARSAVRIPILRKDFIIDKKQICEAKIWGADVILLIAAALTPEKTAELACFARLLGLEVLLEIHGSAELEHLCPYIDVVGVNNRNLSTFATDVSVSMELADKIPAQFVKISESGISDPETVRQLRAVGYRGFLMGENFMKQSDPALALAQFIERI